MIILTCTLSVSHQYLALDGIYHPALSCNPKQLDSSTLAQMGQADGGLTLSAALFQANLARPVMQESTDHNSAPRAQIHTVSYSRFTRRYWGNPG